MTQVKFDRVVIAKISYAKTASVEELVATGVYVSSVTQNAYGSLQYRQWSPQTMALLRQLEEQMALEISGAVFGAPETEAAAPQGDIQSVDDGVHKAGLSSFLGGRIVKP